MTHRRFVPRCAFRFVSALVFVAILALLGGCDASHEAPQPPEPSQAPPDLAELPAIGGVQDVWAFEFGLQADRERVRAELGEPGSVVESRAGEDETGPTVIRWLYEQLEVTFLIDATGENEYLLSVRIEGDDVPVRGGLSVGMPVDDAIELLGEPRVTNDTSRVYFYQNATIELIVGDGEVKAITLARALP